MVELDGRTSRRRGRAVVLVLGLAVVAYDLAVVAGSVDAADGVLALDLQQTALGALALIVTGLAARRSSGRTRAVWSMLALVLALDVMGDLWWVALDLSGDTPYVSGADVLYLASYPLLVGAMWLIATGRGGREGQRAMVDGLVLAAGLGLFFWEAVLVAPGSLEAATSGVHRVVLVLYPMVDLLLLGGFAGALLSSRQRGQSLGWLLVYVGSFVVADVVYVVAANGSERFIDVADVGYAVAFVAAAMAALAPDAARLAERRDDVADGGRGRFVALAAAVVAPAITAAIVLGAGVEVNTFVFVGSTVLLAVLVAWRVAWAVESERTARRTTESAHAQLDHLARHDTLTGLPNRYALLERLARRDGPVTVLFVDLDRFKQVNDTVGHSFGDEVLREAAARVVGQLRAGDTAHRLGGDEFVVVAEAVDHADDGESLARRLVEALSRPFRSGGVEWYLGASVGVAVSTAPDPDGGDAEQLLRRADMAMFAAKRDPHGSVRRFDATMQADLEERHSLEVAIRRALDADEFEPAFQPVVRLADGSVAGFETLARWRRPDGSVRPAGEFVPVAEQSGLLPQIDDRLLRRACAFAVRWNERHPSAVPAYVTFNVSPSELTSPDLLDRLDAAVAVSGVDPRTLVLELTEGALVRAPEQVADRLAAVSRMGIRIALDDFGTGYSSLSHLTRFPVDVIKVDRSFVVDLDPEDCGPTVAAATCQLARTLGIEVVAEGVETVVQARALEVLGVAFVQGYLLSHPLEEDAAMALGAVRLPASLAGTGPAARNA